MSWARSIAKILKTLHHQGPNKSPKVTLSEKAMDIMDSFAVDLFERVANESVKLLRLTNKRTLTAREIQTACRLVLPGELGLHAIHEGAKAVTKLTQNLAAKRAARDAEGVDEEA